MLSFTSRKPLSSDEPFVENSCVFITSGTFQKKPFIGPEHRKEMLLESLDFNCYKWSWRLLAYVILDNHYHLVAQTPPGDLSRMAHIIQSAHSYCAYHWRREDPNIRSRIWWNFWDMRLSDQAQLIGHINFVHRNPKQHGYVEDPAAYRFSSYADYLSQSPETVRNWERQHPPETLEIIDSF